MEWIKVSDELPKAGQKVMVKGYYGSLSQPAGIINHDGCIHFDITFGGYFWMRLYEFTHWMPLPPNPSESK